MPTRGWKHEKEMTDAQPASSAKKKACSSEKSQLATQLLHMMASGLMSAIHVQVLAHAAILDGAQHSELNDLAKSGAFGSHPGNCNRDIMTKFIKDVVIAEADVVPTYVKDPKTNAIVEEPTSIFLPHKMVNSLSKYDKFEELLCAGLIRGFWQAVVASGDPKLVNHPMTRVPGWMDIFVPMWIHGDGVEFQSRDSLMVFSFGFLLNVMAALDSSMLLGAMPKSCTVPQDTTCAGTWAPLWRWYVWSFIALFIGKFPKQDPDGNPCEQAGGWLTPGKHRFVVWCLEGDHEYFSNALGLPHWASNVMCWDCDSDVTVPTKHWKNLTTHQCVTKTLEEVKNNPPSQHPIFSLPGVTSKNVFHDALHVVFNHGILAHLLGSVMLCLCWATGPGRQQVSPETRLALIWEKVQQFYTENKTSTRLTNLKIKMFCCPKQPHADYPSLKSKAGETKHFLPALLWVMQLLCDGSPLHNHIVAAMQAVNRLVLLWDQAEFVPTPAQGDRCEALCREFLQHYQWLNKWGETNDKYVFHIVQKFHMFEHLCNNFRFLNPRAAWCFKAEDYVGKISRIATSVLPGVRTSQLPKKLAKKYRIHLHLRLTRPV